jgi:serine/threonine-protein kinase
LLDLRMSCLDRRLGEMRALTALLARAPDPELLGKAAKAVSALTPLDVCADTEALASAIPLPDDPALRAQVDALRTRLDEISALRDAGKYKDGLELAAEAAAQARELEYAPARAEALHLRARLLAQAGDPKKAEVALYEALQAAADARDHSRVAEAWIALVHVMGARDDRYDEALGLRAAADAAVAQAGGKDVHRASLLGSLGLVLSAKGEFEAARELHERALAIEERAFGAEHRRVAVALGNLANALAEQGQYAAARVHYERALPIQENGLGAHHPEVGYTLNNLANVLSYEGQHELAKRQFERALAIWEVALPPNHPLIATCLNNLGSVSSAMHDTKAAADYYQRALVMLEASFGAEHPAVGSVLGNLGENDVDRGEFDSALERCARALAIMEAVLGSDNADLAYSLTCIGRAHSGKGAARKARPPLERALALREASPGDALELATTRFALARALWSGGGNRGRAVELARKAQAAFAEAGEHQRKELEEVVAALALWAP